jgi:hypothetical protein
MNPAANHCPLPKFALWSLALDSVRQIFRPFGPLFPRNPFFPALRSGHRLFQQPSPGKQFLSSLHVVFITGFSLLTFTVASRVVLGHSGQSEKFRASLWPVLVLCALISLAMLTRVTADWLPKVQMSHYAYAAVAWISGVLIWGAFILPGTAKANEE